MADSTQQDSTYEAALQKMHSLEALASTDWPSACRQMITLYPVASDGYMHDICDSIDLWIYERGLTTELADHLRHVISQESDPDFKRIYEVWLHRPPA